MKSVLRFPMLNAERDADLDYNPENPINFYGNDYDAVKEKLEQLFRNWKVLEDERPLIDYQFKVSINGARCEGSVSVKAVDSDDAYQKAQEKVSDRLCRAFPELDIEYDVEPVESEGYPIFLNSLSTWNQRAGQWQTFFRTWDIRYTPQTFISLKTYRQKTVL